MSLGLPAVWRDYRNRRRALLAALAVTPIVALPGAWLASVDRVVPGHLVSALWATSLAATVVWFAAFRCPHCARPFHWSWVVANPLSRECLHCGFAKWRDPDAGRRFVGR